MDPSASYGNPQNLERVITDTVTILNDVDRRLQALKQGIVTVMPQLAQVLQQGQQPQVGNVPFLGQQGISPQMGLGQNPGMMQPAQQAGFPHGAPFGQQAGGLQHQIPGTQNLGPQTPFMQQQQQPQQMQQGQPFGPQQGISGQIGTQQGQIPPGQQAPGVGWPSFRQY